MIYKERLLLTDCPPLKEVIYRVSSHRHSDVPNLDGLFGYAVRNMENLIGVYLNFHDYGEDLDEFLDYLDQLNLYDSFDDVMSHIDECKDLTWNKLNLFDIKVFTSKGLMGLIYLIPDH